MATPQDTAAYLRSLNTSDRVRAAAFDAVHNADDESAERLLSQLPFSDDVKAELWDLRAGGTVSGGSAPVPAGVESPAGPGGSAAGRFLSNAADVLNPITAVKGAYNAVRHPGETYDAMVEASADQYGKARDAFDQGRYSEAVGHGAAGTIPFVGPAAAEAGEQIAAGDVAGGLGRTTGMLAPGAAIAGVRGRVAHRARTGAPATLERQAAQQVSQRVLAPGNVAFKGKAEHIAPEMLRRGLKGGREELAEAADEGMAAAGSSIDDAINASGGAQAGVGIDPIVAQLQRRIDSLTLNGQPIKGAEGRVAGLQARIDQIEGAATARQLSFDDLRRIRDENYRLADEAKAYRRMGNPQLSDEGFAATETGSAIRQEFAARSPEHAAANADYTFFKTLGDVLDPVQGRPKVTAPSQGITGGAATTGAVVGNMVSPKLALVLGVVRPWIQRMRSTPEWQLADAHTKMRLAEAIRNGDVPTAQKLMVRISEGAGVSATNPTESRNRTTGPSPRAPLRAGE